MLNAQSTGLMARGAINDHIYSRRVILVLIYWKIGFTTGLLLRAALCREGVARGLFRGPWRVRGRQSKEARAAIAVSSSAR